MQENLVFVCASDALAV